jgi:DNA (cytosine-5)-methyltransferase 1
LVTYGVRLERSDLLRLPAHHDAQDVQGFSAWVKTKVEEGDRLAVDLFSGAGGLSLGLRDAGWQVVLGVDTDERALATHAHNFGGLSLHADLSTAAGRETVLTALDGIPIDLVAGGPPCQPFSRAGRSKIRSLVQRAGRPEYDERRDLWRAFLDLAVAIQPRAILMENVPDVALGDGFAIVRSMADQLETSGYDVEYRLVDAWRYGVPQHRKRLIFLARRDGESLAWPTDRPLTVLADAIGDLPKLTDTTGGRELPYHDAGNANEFVARMRDAASRGIVHDHMTRPVRDDDREAFALMRDGTRYSDIPAHLRRYTVDSFDDKYTRLRWSELSRSITAHIAKDGYWYIHPEEDRTLTVREAARIQTFPDRFRFSGTRSDAFRQIGNAVPPMLAQSAATALLPGVAPEEVSNRLREGRDALTRWAEQARRGDLWARLPSPDVTPAIAAVAVLTARQDVRRVDDVLAAFKGAPKLTAPSLRSLREAVTSEAGRRALDRLAPLTRSHVPWRTASSIASAVGLLGSQREHLDVLCGHDVLLRTQAALRVAARVRGSKSSEQNRLTDGRVDVAMLIGGGPKAPLRMAALDLLGRTVCRSVAPRCLDCPLSNACAYNVSNRDATSVGHEPEEPGATGSVRLAARLPNS